MEKKLNLCEKLNFDEIDLTAPDIVIDCILNQLPDETNGLVLGKIALYSGPVESYRKPGLSGMAAALGTADKLINIQNELGVHGAQTHKFECYIYTPVYQNYKYRMFFIQYADGNYPVKIVLEESIAKSIPECGSRYTCICNTREELEDLVYSILTSKKVISIMQELIRINQAKKSNEVPESDDDDE